MKKYNKPPDQVIRLVTEEIIQRAIKFSKKHKREIHISKTSGGKGVDVATLNPKTAEGREKPGKVFYTYQTTLHHFRVRLT